MHRLSRLLGVWSLLIAMVALVVDATKTLGANGTFVITPLGSEWQSLFPGTFEAAKQAVEAKMGADFWTSFVLPALQMPAWLLFGVLGVALYWLGQKRRQVEVFIN